MLALNLYVCECCGKVGKPLITPILGVDSVKTGLCEECFYRFKYNPLNMNDFIKKYQTIEVAKNKKILDIILADAKNKIKEQWGVEA